MDCCAVMSFRHDKADVLINSQQVQLGAQDWANMLPYSGEGPLKLDPPPHMPEDFWAVNDCCGRKNVFFRHWQVVCASVNNPSHKVLPAILTNWVPPS